MAPGLVQDMNISPENWGSKTFYLKTTSTQVLQVLSEFFVGKKAINFETATCKSKGSIIFWWTCSHFCCGGNKKAVKKNMHPSIFGGLGFASLFW